MPLAGQASRFSVLKIEDDEEDEFDRVLRAGTQKASSAASAKKPGASAKKRAKRRNKKVGCMPVPTLAVLCNKCTGNVRFYGYPPRAQNEFGFVVPSRTLR